MRPGILALFTLCACIPACSLFPPFNAVRPSVVDAEGPYLHSHSLMNFPDRLNGYRRGEILSYDPSQKDISVSYHRMESDPPLHITIYIYPTQTVLPIMSETSLVDQARTSLLQSHFEIAKKAIMNAHPWAVFHSDQDYILHQTRGVQKGKMAIYEYEEFLNNQHQEVQSRIYLFNDEDWVIKYRITFPKQSHIAVNQEIDHFLKSFRWP